MKLSRQTAFLVPLTLFALLALSISCGGGGNSGPPPPPPPPPGPPQPLVITSPSSLPNALVGDTYNQRLQATGGTPPFTWRLGTGEYFVNGLTLSSDGVLSGVLTLAGGWCPTFWVTDSGPGLNQQQNSKTICFNIYNRLAVVTGSLPSGLITRNYDQRLQFFGGASPYSWSLVAGGSLPPGLTLESSGRLYGIPTTPGSFSFTVELKDASNQQASKGYTVAVYDGPLVTTNPQLPAYISGQPSYSLTFQAAGGVPPYVWDSPPLNPYGSPNNLPTGFTLTSDGVFSGSNNNYGYWGFFVRVTDSLGHADVFNCGLAMVQPLSLPSRTLPGGNVGIDYFQQLSWIGGLGPYSWGLAAGSGPLPPGISLQPFGYLTGTPTAPGNFDFTVELRDSINEVATQSYNILIKNDVIITSWSLPYGVIGQAYSSPTQSVVGGTPPYTWSVGSGTFPPGLTVDPSTSQIAGTPTTAGSFSFELQATDSSNPPQVGLRQFTILIRPTLSIITTTVADAAVNVSYYSYIQAEGGQFPPYTVRIIAGSLPSGIRIGTMSDYSGYVGLSGSPTTTGVSNFTVEFSDTSTPPLIAARDFSIRTDPQLRIDQGTVSFPDVLEGQSFTYTFTATGGFLPYVWSVRGAPPGMAVDSASGVFSGAPTQPLVGGGVFADVQDSANPPQHASQLFFWRVIELLRLRTSQFPPVSVGMPVRMNPTATGGTCCAYTWSLSSGTLPPGLSITGAYSGEIRGIPTTPGTFDFILQVKDSGTGSVAQSVTRSFSIVVKAQGQLGRNDSIATATPLSNGSFLASISPADDGFGALHPDNDYYAISADPGAIVVVDAAADQSIPPGSAMDSVIEILDATGLRHSTCNTFAANFTFPCMNDDQYSGNPNSKLYFQVPGTTGDPPVTFYVRVVDWTGMARPDFFYFISISGAN